MAYLWVLNIVVGGIAGTLLGLFVVGGNAGGLSPIWGIVAPSFAGSITGSPLGVFSGITGGLIGGFVGAVFVLLPLSWLFTHSVMPALLVKAIVAGTLAAIIPLVFPH